MTMTSLLWCHLYLNPLSVSAVFCPAVFFTTRQVLNSIVSYRKSEPSSTSKRI